MPRNNLVWRSSALHVDNQRAAEDSSTAKHRDDKS
jgi:hypothetical protein